MTISHLINHFDDKPFLARYSHGIFSLILWGRTNKNTSIKTRMKIHLKIIFLAIFFSFLPFLLILFFDRGIFPLFEEIDLFRRDKLLDDLKWRRMVQRFFYQNKYLRIRYSPAPGNVYEEKRWKDRKRRCCCFSSS